MKITEADNKEDILIMLMIQEREKQIVELEKENANLKRLLLNITEENCRFKKMLVK